MNYKEYRDRLRELAIKEAELRVHKEECEVARAKLDLKPSRSMYAVVRRERSNWVCYIPASEDMHDNVIAYGASPQQAMDNFDALFLGVGLDLDPHDPDNQDSELEEF